MSLDLDLPSGGGGGPSTDTLADVMSRGARWADTPMLAPDGKTFRFLTEEIHPDFPAIDWYGLGMTVAPANAPSGAILNGGRNCLIGANLYEGEAVEAIVRTDGTYGEYGVGSIAWITVNSGGESVIGWSSQQFGAVGAGYWRTEFGTAIFGHSTNHAGIIRHAKGAGSVLFGTVAGASAKQYGKGPGNLMFGRVEGGGYQYANGGCLVGGRTAFGGSLQAQDRSNLVFAHSEGDTYATFVGSVAGGYCRNGRTLYNFSFAGFTWGAAWGGSRNHGGSGIVLGASCISSNYGLTAGLYCSNSGYWGVSLGIGAYSRIQGQFAHSADHISVYGDSQLVINHAHRLLTNTTPAELTINAGAPGASNVWTVPDESTMSGIIIVTMRQDTGGKHATFEFLCQVERTGGTLAIVGGDAPSRSINPDGITPPSIVVSGSRVAVEATGNTSENIRARAVFIANELHFAN